MAEGRGGWGARGPMPCGEVAARCSKQIGVAVTRVMEEDIWRDAGEVRLFLRPLIEQSPELFPAGVAEGYQLTGLSLGVPCWVVSEIFGRNDMFWHRHLERLGRNSLVGTTVRDPDKLPQHLVADEHHADWCGQKGYVAFTAGAGCVLGVALTDAADEPHLREAYGKFADESRQVQPEYAPHGRLVGDQQCLCGLVPGNRDDLVFPARLFEDSRPLPQSPRVAPAILSTD